MKKDFKVICINDSGIDSNIKDKPVKGNVYTVERVVYKFGLGGKKAYVLKEFKNPGLTFDIDRFSPFVGNDGLNFSWVDSKEVEVAGVDTSSMDSRHWNVITDRNSYPITKEAFEKAVPDFMGWVSENFRFTNMEDYFLYFSTPHEGEYDEEKYGFNLRCVFFTETYKYEIYIRTPSSEGDRGYLTGYAYQFVNQKEGYKSISEMSDGPYSKETFLGVIGSVLSHELKELKKL